MDSWDEEEKRDCIMFNYFERTVNMLQGSTESFSKAVRVLLHIANISVSSTFSIGCVQSLWDSDGAERCFQLTTGSVGN